MGREWYLNWGTKSSSKKGKTGGGGGDGGGNGRSGGGSRKPTTPPTATVAAAAAASAGGCMNAVLHLFDFQHFQLCLHPQDGSFLPDDPTPLIKGVEAPRNSLESITEDDKNDHLHISKGIKTKTNRRDTGLKLVQAPRGKIEDLSSESSCSPASARTPTLVARLMGLDILPESNTTTPRSSHSQSFSPHIIRPSTPPISTNKTRKSCSACSTPGTRASYNDNTPGPRSSPETPRSLQSTRRRRSMEVVEHHRLSLQINKENSIQKEMELSRPSCSAITTKRRDGKNYDYEEVAKSPSYYARQIMKQVKETVSRRVGVDITNTISNSSREHRRDEHLLSSSSSSTTKTKPPTTKPKKSKKLHKSSPSNDENHKQMSSKLSEQLPPPLPSPPTPAVLEVPVKTVIVQPKPLECEDEGLKKSVPTTTTTTTVTSCKKPLKAYNSIRNKKEEQFVHPSTTTTMTSKKCKKTMLSSDLLHGTTVPSLVPLKKDSSPTKLLHYQGVTSEAQLSKRLIISNPNTSTSTSTSTAARLSRYPRQRIDERRQEEATHAPADRWRSGRKEGGTVGNSVMEFQYISRILKCSGIDRDTPVSFMRWYLPLHPLDPSIYHTLEATHYITTSDRFCEQLNLSINRKLIFHLVDEMLANMLKPYVKLKSHYHHHRRYPKNHHDTQMNGFQLVKTLCSKIRSFPSADCQTLQDIDALVEKDMPRIGAASNLIDYHDDGEGDDIVTEIERFIMDSLVQEICYIVS